MWDVTGNVSWLSWSYQQIGPKHRAPLSLGVSACCHSITFPISFRQTSSNALSQEQLKDGECKVFGKNKWDGDWAYGLKQRTFTEHVDYKMPEHKTCKNVRPLLMEDANRRIHRKCGACCVKGAACLNQQLWRSYVQIKMCCGKRHCVSAEMTCGGNHGKAVVSLIQRPQ